MRKPGPYAAKRSARLEAMEKLELAVAAENPDHHEEARRMAGQILAMRGGFKGDIYPKVPGFVPAMDAPGLGRLLLGSGRTLRIALGAGALLAFLASFAAVAVTDELKRPALQEGYEAGLISRTDYFDAGRKLTPEEYGQAEEAGVEFESSFATDARLEEVLLHRVAGQTESGRRYLLARSATPWAIGALVFFWAAWILASTLRAHPARILLLRKFNVKDLAKSMEKTISIELRPFGHVATLSDRFIRKSLWESLGGLIPTSIPHAILVVVWLPLRFVLRQFNRARWGPPWVGSARDYRNLALRLRDRISLNLEIAMNARQEAFIVRTHDRWWREVVLLMIRSSDVIVADLSNVTAGTEWELEKLDELDAFTGAVLIAREDRAGPARAALARRTGGQDRPIHLYARNGAMKDRVAFREDVLHAMSRKLAKREGRQVADGRNG